MAAKQRKPARRRSSPAPIAGDLTLLIGTISGTVQSLKEAVEADRDEWYAERQANAEYRQGIRETLDQIKGQVAAIAGPDGKRIDRLEKVAGEWKSFRNKAAGAMLSFTVFWALLGDIVKAKVKGMFS